MSDGAPAILCEKLSKRYETASGTIHALRDLDLAVARGEFLAVTGPSGCGKTTFLNLLGALDRPSDGRLEVFGRSLSGLSPKERALFRRGTVGFVFQQFNLIPTLTALENVALPLQYAGTPRRERLERAGALLDRVALAARADHFPLLLSGGEQQRVALARASAPRPDILLADEPTGNLDATNGAAIMDLLFALRDRHGATLVLVTHAPDLAARCDRVVHLLDGRIDQGAEAAQ